MVYFYLLQFIRIFFVSRRFSKHALGLIRCFLEMRRLCDAFWTVL